MSPPTEFIVEPPVTIPIRKHSLLGTSSLHHPSASAGHLDSILRSQALLISTTTHVYSWTTAGVKAVFRSRTGGIMATQSASPRRQSLSKRSDITKQTANNILAVADRTVLILHDVEKGMQRSYRLRGAKGSIGKLHHDPTTSRLFYLNSLSNRVQIFSPSTQSAQSTHSRLEPRSAVPAEHPSPPSSFAFSPQLNLLVSTSDNPPLVLLSSLSDPCESSILRVGSTSAVVTAVFDDQGHILALGFADGAIEIWEITIRITISASLLARKEKVHAVCSPEDHGIREGLPEAEQDKLGPSIILAFVPGFQCRLLSAGADGRCLLFDMDNHQTPGMTVKKQWSMSSGVLALASTTCSPMIQDMGATSAASQPAESKSVIAVGMANGQVALFDAHGKPLARHVLPRTSPVVGLEWTEHDLAETSPSIVTSTASQQVSNASHNLLEENRKDKNEGPENIHSMTSSQFKMARAVDTKPPTRTPPSIPTFKSTTDAGLAATEPTSPTKSVYYTPGDKPSVKNEPRKQPIQGSPSNTSRQIEKQPPVLQGKPPSLLESTRPSSLGAPHRKAKDSNEGRPAQTDKKFKRYARHFSDIRKSLVGDAAVMDVPDIPSHESNADAERQSQKENDKLAEPSLPEIVRTENESVSSSHDSSDMVLDPPKTESMSLHADSIPSPLFSSKQTRTFNSQTPSQEAAPGHRTLKISINSSGETSSETIFDWKQHRPVPLSRPTTIERKALRFSRRSLFPSRPRWSHHAVEGQAKASLSGEDAEQPAEMLERTRTSRVDDDTASVVSVRVVREDATPAKKDQRSARSSTTQPDILQELRSLRREILEEIRGQRPWLESLISELVERQGLGIKYEIDLLHRPLPGS